MLEGWGGEGGGGQQVIKAEWASSMGVLEEEGGGNRLPV